ncbi:MAG TPA: hypothetical protein VL987_12005 [Cellvibrio sp.]|nr:hypothetical protein [Cellvibrio sp.]
MSRTVTGTLLLPNGQPMANARIFFTAKRTEAVSIVEGVNAFFDTDNDGDYSQVIVDGWYSVSIEWQADAAGATVRRWPLGYAVVEAGANTTLEALIIASNPAASVETTLLYEVLEQAQQARDLAEAAADAAAASAATITPTTGPNDTTPGHLWRTDDLVKTLTPTDTTVGSIMRTGDAGWNGLNSTTITDANGILVAGNYQLTSGVPAAFQNFPTWAQPSRSTMLVMGNFAPYGTQLYFDRTLARAAYRIYSGSFGSWIEFWTDANLVKAVSTTDSAVGRVMLTGAGGILGRSVYQSVYDVNSTGDTVIRTVTGNAGTKPSDNIPGFPDNCTLLPIRRSSGENSSQMAWALSGSTPRAAIRHFDGISWTLWGELWHSVNTSVDVKAVLSASNNAAIRSAIAASSLPPYTLSTVPSASANTNLLVVITDLAGGREPCFSNGTNWLRCSDKTIAN